MPTFHLTKNEVRLVKNGLSAVPKTLDKLATSLEERGYWRKRARYAP